MPRSIRHERRTDRPARVRIATLDVRAADVLLPFGLVGLGTTLAVLLAQLV